MRFILTLASLLFATSTVAFPLQPDSDGIHKASKRSVTDLQALRHAPSEINVLYGLSKPKERSIAGINNPQFSSEKDVLYVHHSKRVMSTNMAMLIRTMDRYRKHNGITTTKGNTMKKTAYIYLTDRIFAYWNTFSGDYDDFLELRETYVWLKKGFYRWPNQSEAQEANEVLGLD